MKKRIIFFILFISCSITWGQEFVKLTMPCTEEILQRIPGRWFSLEDALYTKIPKQQQQEILNRLDIINHFVKDIYPSFYGLDAYWYRYTADGDFAATYKYEKYPDAGELRDIMANSIPFVNYFYNAHFREFSPGREPNEYIRGVGEDGANLSIYANILDPILRKLTLKDQAEIMQVDGRPIKMMSPKTGMWKGHDVYSSETGNSTMHKIILLHRDGMLPYIPVTRKQYLDRCIAYIAKFFTPNEEALKLLELLAGKEERDEQVKNYQKQKEDVLKHYQEELDATTKAGLLDAPVIVPLELCNIDITRPIFTTEEAGGEMLVTENPVYIRKDLPKYVPQFFIFELKKSNWVLPPFPDPCKVIEEKFPIEKLQAMIDK